MPKILRITTVPISLNLLLKGQLKYMREAGFEVITASANGPEIHELVIREGVKHFVIPFTRVISPFQDLWCLWKLIVLIRKEKPDIIHTHTPKAGLLGMMAAWILRIPNRLHTVAGIPLMEANGMSRIVLKITESLTYRWATKIYPNSLNMKTWMKAHFKIPQDKLKVLGAGSSNGIDLIHFNKSAEIIMEAKKIREELKISDLALVFIFVGRLVKDKGITELVEAYLEVKNQNTQLLLVGSFEDQRDAIDKKTKTIIKGEPTIHAIGFQKDVRPYFATADVFVFPSYREGFPNVVLQAAAMGLPSIVTEINGCNEIIESNYNGLIVQPKSVDSLSNAMSKLLQDVDLRKSLAEKGIESIKPYEQQEIWRLIAQEYTEFCSPN